MKIPFAIIDDGSIELSEATMAHIDPAMSMQEYAGFMYREMMNAYSMASLNDIPSFEKGAELAFYNSQSAGTSVTPLSFFAKAMTSALLVKPEHVKAGIYFRPYKYSDKYYGKITLFPKLYLSDNSIPSVLQDPYGALHARGDIGIQTSGSATFTASMPSGGSTNISAKDVRFETQTFDYDVITQRTFESASGGNIWDQKPKRSRLNGKN